MEGNCTVEPRLLKIPRLELNGKHWRWKREERAKENRRREMQIKMKKEKMEEEKKEGLKAKLSG